MSELRYSIRDLENFTQIKAHTIRIWEKRYGLLTPRRTETNIRYYNDEDLKKILNIHLLYKSGHKISSIAALSESEIVQASKDLITNQAQDQSLVDSITLSILDFNGEKIKSQMLLAIEECTIDEFYEKTIVPVFKRIGQLWQVDSIDIIHEHYFSNIFREFLIYNIGRLGSKGESDKAAILFLHDTEEHEFSILLFYYLLKKAGYLCHYFGQKVPILEVKEAFNKIGPDLVVTTFVSKISDRNFKKVESELLKFSKKANVLVSGNQLNQMDKQLSKDLIFVETISHLRAIIDRDLVLTSQG
ncbi:MAG: MerR family transcriptional regulator [Flavobacteriales bacterium]|jgi:DNA-binding transcriptional MerR regulator|nr:MerR family transcriptional regulator [Flavobacteriales bacterium]MBT3963863.1 MerR family transcriptional regulator [Flavobacteriales bacterium]MBT4706229.1 MerR family transcriptional regulator [Flavobacteriales bacterium]MBT4929521.1 MerR family transcriptional regulator [Flavobacteriales bacterium]MBT6133744.1 MerR family transcriptional regulator [Flavobacteriales bacterium]